MKNYFISFVSSDVTGTGKSKTWKEETDAVNSMSSVLRTTEEVKQKWFV